MEKREMEKQEIDSILLANFYFIKCKFENPVCSKTEMARRFFLDKISKILSKRNIKYMAN